jgi:hypothetical protein
MRAICVRFDLEPERGRSRKSAASELRRRCHRIAADET